MVYAHTKRVTMAGPGTLGAMTLPVDLGVALHSVTSTCSPRICPEGCNLQAKHESLKGDVYFWTFGCERADGLLPKCHGKGKRAWYASSIWEGRFHFRQVGGTIHSVTQISYVHRHRVLYRSLLVSVEAPCCLREERMGRAEWRGSRFVAVRRGSWTDFWLVGRG